MADTSFDITQLIPQRPPFLFIKQIEEYRPAEGQLIASTSFSPGDLPVNAAGQITQAALIEALAQTAAALVGLKNGTTSEPAIGYLAAINNFSFSSRVLADEVVILTVTVQREMGAFMIVHGECRVASNIVAAGDLTFFLDN